MKQSILIGAGVLIALILVGYIMFGNDADNTPEPRTDGINEELSIQEEPSLSSDADVFNEFDAALDGLS
ncbi:MAG: hypothetical protein AABX53_03515 [Nanoarchaeota archaeon]